MSVIPFPAARVVNSRISEAVSYASTMGLISSGPNPCASRYPARNSPTVAVVYAVMFEVIPAQLVMVPTTPVLFRMYLYTLGTKVGPDVEPLAALRLAVEAGVGDSIFSLDARAYGSSDFARTCRSKEVRYKTSSLTRGGTYLDVVWGSLNLQKVLVDGMKFSWKVLRK